jgi:hypothetical protein
VERTVALEQRQTGNAVAGRNRQAIIAPIGRERRGDEIDHLSERGRDPDKIGGLGPHAHDAGEPGEQHRHRDRDRQRDERVIDTLGG